MPGLDSAVADETPIGMYVKVGGFSDFPLGKTNIKKHRNVTFPADCVFDGNGDDIASDSKRTIKCLMKEDSLIFYADFLARYNLDTATQKKKKQ